MCFIFYLVTCLCKVSAYRHLLKTDLYIYITIILVKTISVKRFVFTVFVITVFLYFTRFNRRGFLVVLGMVTRICSSASLLGRWRKHHFSSPLPAQQNLAYGTLCWDGNMDFQSENLVLFYIYASRLIFPSKCCQKLNLSNFERWIVPLPSSWQNLYKIVDTLDQQRCDSRHSWGLSTRGASWLLLCEVWRQSVCSWAYLHSQWILLACASVE